MGEKPLTQALKEFGRLLVFSIPALLIQVISGDASLTASYGGTVLLVLKAIDKYIHESPTKAIGVVPF